ncbi:MAG: serine hydrolase [Rubrivivax sp.]|nr:serine hydrolase [Rubrivivax sp.]
MNARREFLLRRLPGAMLGALAPAAGAALLVPAGAVAQAAPAGSTGAAEAAGSTGATGTTRAAASDEVFPRQAWARPQPAPGGAAAAELPAWHAERLRAADEAAASLRTDAWLVVHRGRLVHAYGEIALPRNVYSVRKSVLSVLTGIHVDRGVIDLGQSLAALGVDDIEGLTAQEKAATWRQLLQSRSGVYHPAAYETREAKAQRPARGSHAPGTFWYYNNWDFNTAGGLFQQRTGKPVFEALRDDLAGPLQFEDFDLARDTESVLESSSKYPAYVMKLSARDLARLGLLMARGGRWRGRQLVSEKWVAESTAPHSNVPGGWQRYASMWWVPRRAWPFWQRAEGDVFFAWGNGGQFLFVDRGRDLVIVHQVDRPRFFSAHVTPESISGLLQQVLAAHPSS